MPDLPAATLVHISGVIARSDPRRADEVAAAISRLPDVEIAHAEDGRFVLVIEGSSSGAVGARLAEISLLDGVVSASMVYEQIETLESLGEQA